MSQVLDMPAEAARLLLEARRSGRPIDNLPDGCRPRSQAEAHRIQDAMVEAMGGVGGWKIFAGDDPAPLLSPIPARLVFGQDHLAPRGPLPITLVELEIAIVLGEDLPGRDRPYSACELRAAIAGVHPLIELITLSWVDRDKVDRLTQLADLQNSAGFVVGPALVDWAGFDPSGAAATLIFDGQSVGTTPGGAGIETILRTLSYLANHAAGRDLPLKAGHVITTGARLVQATGAAAEIHGVVAGLGTVRTQLA